MKRRKTLFSTAALLLLHIPILAAESPYPLNPDRQPLLVARVADGRKVSELLATAPAVALGLEQADYRGAIPGLGVRVASLRGFLDDLAETGATNPWYCLTQDSLFGPVAGVGWRWPTGFAEDRATDWLAENSFHPDRLAMDFNTRSARGTFLAMANGRDTLKALNREDKTAGAESRDWRNALEAFLAEPTDALGVWINPRPLLGVAALASGLDLRRAFTRLNLSIPHSSRLKLNANGDQIALELALDGLFLNPPESSPDSSLALDYPPPPTDGSFIRLTVAAPVSLLKALGLDTAPLYLANIDFRALVPRVACLDVWLDGEGEQHWALVCLMGEKTAFYKHFRRVLAWADMLGGWPDSFGGIAPVSPTNGDESYSAAFQGRTVLLDLTAIADGNRETIFLTAAERPEDRPAAAKIKVVSGQRERALSWQIGFDEATRMRAARAFVSLASKHGLPQAKSAALTEALPREETGCATVAGDTLTLSSPHGMALWLAPVGRYFVFSPPPPPTSP